MAYSIIDTPQPVTRYLPRLGSIDTIIRYITSRSPHGDKHIQPKEAQAIKAAGKKLAIVHEAWGDFKHAGHGGISEEDGRYDGHYAVQALRNLGAPYGAACYFAVDTDGSAAKLKNNVLPYFYEVSKAFNGTGFRVGIYGPGLFCEAVKKANTAELFWLANAKGWSGYYAFEPHADLVQLLPTHIAGGLDVDPNMAHSDEWGQFTPFSANAETAPGNEIDPDFGKRLGQGLGDTPITVDDLPDGIADKAKTLFKSKIAWLAGGGGSAAATNTLTSDPQTSNLVVQLFSRPAFWVGIICIITAAAIIYFRWRDHGRGQQ